MAGDKAIRKTRDSGIETPHGPWGGKNADLLTDPRAASVFPPTERVRAIPSETQPEKRR